MCVDVDAYAVQARSMPVHLTEQHTRRRENDSCALGHALSTDK